MPSNPARRSSWRRATRRPTASACVATALNRSPSAHARRRKCSSLRRAEAEPAFTCVNQPCDPPGAKLANSETFPTARNRRMRPTLTLVRLVCPIVVSLCAFACSPKQDDAKPLITPAVSLTTTSLAPGVLTKVQYRFSVAADAPAFAPDLLVFVHG